MVATTISYAQPAFNWATLLNPLNPAYTTPGSAVWGLAPILKPVLPIIALSLVVVWLKFFLFLLSWFLKVLDVIFKLIEVIPGE